MAHFYLTLPSNSSMKFYPNNTVQKFTTRLENQISLNGEWEVGLFELEYKRSWYTISPEGGRFLFSYVIGNIQHVERLTISGGYYSTIDRLLNRINGEIIKVLSGKREKEHWCMLRIDEISRKIDISLQRGDYFNFGEELSLILGITERVNAVDGNVHFVGQEICDLDRKVSSLYVYCDILEHVPIGDVKAPLLRAVGTSGKHGEVVRRIFDKTLYVPVQKKNFDSIELDIRTDTGQPVPFESGKCIATLHFRLSKNPYFLQ